MRGQARRRRGQHRGAGASRGRRARLGETEVEQRRACLGQHDVAGLQITMDDAHPMGLVESIRDLNSVPESLIN